VDSVVKEKEERRKGLEIEVSELKDRIKEMQEDTKVLND
jgi:hypothetical protein